ncbi:hypothetical protein [Nocardiopsis coralliicola]
MNDSGSASANTVWVFIIGGVAVVGLLSLLMPGMSGNPRCGDYSLRGGEYIRTENRGTYDKRGGEYIYVGCKSGRSGFSSGSGSDSGSGSGFWSTGGSDSRGGGPGWGK